MITSRRTDSRPGRNHRVGVRGLVERPFFQKSVTAVIVLNAITLGLETSPAVMSGLGGLVSIALLPVTGESWPDIARELMIAAPLSWIFFVIYILGS